MTKKKFGNEAQRLKQFQLSVIEFLIKHWSHSTTVLTTLDEIGVSFEDTRSDKLIEFLRDHLVDSFKIPLGEFEIEEDPFSRDAVSEIFFHIDLKEAQTPGKVEEVYQYLSDVAAKVTNRE